MIPLAVLAATVPIFAYGHIAGNIRAERVTIARSGVVSVDGIAVRRRVGAQKLSSLEALARRQRFASLTARTICRSSLPDFATRYITYGGRTVRVRGSCSKRFELLYTALTRATGIP
jgi:hypothetical protein